MVKIKNAGKFAADIVKGVQEANVERRENEIEFECNMVKEDCIAKAACALLEVGVDREKAKRLLIKYWGEISGDKADEFLDYATKKREKERLRAQGNKKERIKK